MADVETERKEPIPEPSTAGLTDADIVAHILHYLLSSNCVKNVYKILSGFPRLYHEGLLNMVQNICSKRYNNLSTSLPKRHPEYAVREFCKAHFIGETSTRLSNYLRPKFKDYVKELLKQGHYTLEISTGGYFNDCCALTQLTFGPKVIEEHIAEKVSVESMKEFMSENHKVLPHSGEDEGRYSGGILTVSKEMFTKFNKGVFKPLGWHKVFTNPQDQSITLFKDLENGHLQDMRNYYFGYMEKVIELSELSYTASAQPHMYVKTRSGRGCSFTLHRGFKREGVAVTVNSETLNLRKDAINPIEIICLVDVPEEDMYQIKANRRLAEASGFKPMTADGEPFLSGMYPDIEESDGCHWILPMWRNNPNYLEDR